MDSQRPAGRWVGSVLDPAYLPPRADGLDKEDPAKPRMLARLKQQRAMQEILGIPVMFDTTILIAPHGEWIGECTFGKNKVRWSIWAPHRRTVVDIFPKTMPEPQELEARQAFCTQHRLRYLVVPPMHTFDLEDLRDALKDEKEVANA